MKSTCSFEYYAQDREPVRNYGNAHNTEMVSENYQCISLTLQILIDEF